MKQIEAGDTVRVHYTGTLTDGTQFDTSIGREPIEFVIGGGHVIPGFENALLGMVEGDTKNVTVEPSDAYGPHDPRLMQVVERTRIPADVELNIGTVLQASDPNGNHIHLTVVDLDDENATLDANHPLAGKSLIFELEFVEFVS